MEEEAHPYSATPCDYLQAFLAQACTALVYTLNWVQQVSLTAPYCPPRPCVWFDREGSRMGDSRGQDEPQGTSTEQRDFFVSYTGADLCLGPAGSPGNWRPPATPPCSRSGTSRPARTLCWRCTELPTGRSGRSRCCRHATLRRCIPSRSGLPRWSAIRRRSSAGCAGAD